MRPREANNRQTVPVAFSDIRIKIYVQKYLYKTFHVKHLYVHFPKTAMPAGREQVPPAPRKSLQDNALLPYNRNTVLKYSIVVPLHNEQENVTDLYARLKSVMEASGETFEMVLVDDGSLDGTFQMLREIAAIDSRVTVVKLRRNFGQTAGLAAGYKSKSKSFKLIVNQALAKNKRFKRVGKGVYKLKG